ncbi:MAG: hypothetical protein RLZZ21_2590 [Planctomycetota bacterium]|jgi:hypothetical protein
MSLSHLLTFSRAALVAAGLVATLCPSQDAAAQPAVADNALAFTIAGEALSLEAPANWKRVQPKSNMIETEFSIPAAEGDAAPGRMTVMGAGGSVQANIDRWYGQFTQPDGSATKDKASTKKLNVSGSAVTLVDVSGTYKDMPGGPFAGGQAVDRPNYRMLAAIVEVPDRGSYFLKFYGPSATVSANADGFRKMVEGMVPAAAK